jgi:hypothetical protein
MIMAICILKESPPPRLFLLRSSRPNLNDVQDSSDYGLRIRLITRAGFNPQMILFDR